MGAQNSGQDRNAPQNGNGGDDALDAMIMGALYVAVGLLALVAAGPVILAWLIGPRLAERPTVLRPVRARTRLAVVALALALPAGYVLTRSWWLPLVTHPKRWDTHRADLVLTVGLWWLALLPLAVIVVRLRARKQGTALPAGQVAPRRASLVRRAAWEATCRDLAKRAGVRTHQRPPKVLDTHAVLPHQLGTATVHDTRSWWVRLWGGRPVLSDWHEGSARSARLVLPAQPSRVVMLGSSGSGKTVGQHRLAVAALEAGWRVLWIDCKGHPADARRLLEQARARGLSTRWLNAADPTGGDPYYLWAGSPRSLAHKAAVLMPSSGVGGTEHYAAWQDYAFQVVGSLSGWTSCGDLVRRLRNPAAYVPDNEDGLADLAALQQKGPGGATMVAGVAAQTSAALRPIAALVDGGPGGWSLDDSSGWDLAVASLDAGAVPGAERVAAALLLDLDAYRVARRADDARPLLVIADELGAVLEEPRVAKLLPRLMEQVRSQGIGLVIAAQSPSTLGDMGPRLMAAGVDLWVGRVDEPDAVVMQIGTTKVAEQAHQGTEAGVVLTGQTAAREQDTLRVDPNVLRTLRPWHFLVFQPGCEPSWAVVPPVPPVQPPVQPLSASPLPSPDHLLYPPRRGLT